MYVTTIGMHQMMLFWLNWDDASYLKGVCRNEHQLGVTLSERTGQSACNAASCLPVRLTGRPRLAQVSSVSLSGKQVAALYATWRVISLRVAPYWHSFQHTSEVTLSQFSQNITRGIPVVPTHTPEPFYCSLLSLQQVDFLLMSHLVSKSFTELENNLKDCLPFCSGI